MTDPETGHERCHDNGRRVNVGSREDDEHPLPDNLVQQRGDT
jgi:hypothetical protein